MDPAALFGLLYVTVPLVFLLLIVLRWRPRRKIGPSSGCCWNGRFELENQAPPADFVLTKRVARLVGRGAKPSMKETMWQSSV
jgi:hypothetical protein